MDDLRIGTAGWNYPGGNGRWTGIVYPVRQGRIVGGKRFDELTFYSERFDTVEVNSSFYRIPSAKTTRSWSDRTPPGFEFSLKLYRRFTHPEADEADGNAPARARKRAEAARITLDTADLDAFREAIAPLAEAGKLGALLAQFPASFKAEPPSVDYLRTLLDAFREHRVAVELRHRSWSDDLGTTLDLLNASKAAWVQIDEPKFRFSIRQNYLPNVTGFYYLRLHGRNAANWWRHEHPDDRYDYLYSPNELEPFVDIAEAVRTLVRKMYLYTNNHFAGKSVANAIMLKERLGLPNRGDYPEAFFERYPHLKGLVQQSAGRDRAATLPLLAE
jgi:uncharacterized protein YecE (DUF72 family)